MTFDSNCPADERHGLSQIMPAYHFGIKLCMLKHRIFLHVF